MLILSVVFSLFFGGKQECISSKASVGEEVLAASHARDNVPDHSLHRDMCITASHGWTFSGGENSNTVLLGSSQVGRRTTQPTKTPTRLIRDGKVIDTHNFTPFLSAIFLKVYGAESFPRYLYSICCLRL